MKHRPITKPLFLILALTLIAGGPGNFVRAESQETRDRQVTGSTDPSLRVEEIVVTARKRPENLQEVPVAITTITANDIIDTGLEGMDRIMMMTPGLNGMQSPQAVSSAFNIRGVGTLGGASGFEDGSISAYMDGVPIPIGQLDSHMLDIEQVEVLRGPQGTLYGKTAQGGAINITSAPPEDTFNARLGGTLGTLGKRGIEAMITGPMVRDRINGRLFLDAQTREGDIINTATGEPLGDVSRFYGRGSVDAAWSDRFSTRLNISYDDLENEDNVFVGINDVNRVNTTASLFEQRETASLGLVNNIRLTDDLDLHLVTGTNRIDVHTRTLQPGLGNIPEVIDTETHLNQEIRFNGRSEKMDWTAGLFGSYFKRDISHTLNGRDNFGQPLVFDDKGDQTATTLAVFGESTYALTQTLKATGGLRLNRDKRAVDETVINQGLFPFYQPFTHRIDEKKTFENWSGRAMLAYIPSTSHTFYGSVSRGYKPGGYQFYHNAAMVAGPMPTPDFDESTSVSYEVGYKGLFFDRRISFDAAAFFTTTEGEHILGFDPTNAQSIFFNVDSESYGLEMSTRARITRSFTLGGSLALTRAVITQDQVLFPEIPGLLPETVIREGDELPNVPDYALHLFGLYRRPLSVLDRDVSGFVRADYSWKSKLWFDATQSVANDAHGVLNLRMGLEDETFSLIAYVDNLTDESYFLSGIGLGDLAVVRPSREREIGVKLTLFF